MQKQLRAGAVIAFTIALWITNVEAAPPDPRAGIDQFNHALDAATRHMSNAESLALWEDDGVSLLPSTPPIVGKKAIGEFLDAVTKQYPGARMQTFDMQCFDIDVSGSWASEWCTEHQVVQLQADKTFDGWGKMLLVLHRGADGKWRIKREMWNQAEDRRARPSSAGSEH